MFNKKLKQEIELLKQEIRELRNKENKFVWCEDTKRVMPRNKVHEVKKIKKDTYEYAWDYNNYGIERRTVFIENKPNFDSVEVREPFFGQGGSIEYYAGTIKVDKPVPKID